MNKIIKFFIGILFVIGSLGVFYYSQEYINYPEHIKLERKLVNHPEFIPSAKYVKIGSSGFNNLVADFYWLDSIQYIGGNAVSSEYKRYLYPMYNLITDINPNFAYPYILGELLLPNANELYEDFNNEELDKFTSQGIALGQKGIGVFCDQAKVEAIKKEFDLKKIIDPNGPYANPCKNSTIPYYLGYIYFWNKFDGVKSSEYYRITAANENAPKGSKIMAAIMQGKSGDRQKAIIMFLSLAESLGNNETESCSTFSSYLGGVLLEGFNQNKTVTSDFVKEVEQIRKEIINEIGNNKNSLGEDSECYSYLNKAVREINLHYLENADLKYYSDLGYHAKISKDLKEKGYIDFEPIDYQQDVAFGIEYYFDLNTGHWDVRMAENN